MYNKWNKISSVWLILATLICIGNSISIIVLRLYYGYADLFPFNNVIAYLVISFVVKFYFSNNYHKDKNLVYLKNNYPSIWEKTFGRNIGVPNLLEYNWFSFISNRMDDGKDETLNIIKMCLKNDFRNFLWAFLLIPITWFFNILLTIFFN